MLMINFIIWKETMLVQELHVAVLGKFHTVWFLGLLMWGIRVVKAFLKTLLGFVTVFFASPYSIYNLY